ncbi:hypothetical protein ACJIZ3_005870 [Penstemon smallii]|uniref:Uncharacterized protein n=1 Tax=Penstemon smallii TaxID=265156 RepID=A0ABD3S647_9LAMI
MQVGCKSKIIFLFYKDLLISLYYLLSPNVGEISATKQLPVLQLNMPRIPIPCCDSVISFWGKLLLLGSSGPVVSFSTNDSSSSMPFAESVNSNRGSRLLISPLLGNSFSKNVASRESISVVLPSSFSPMNT